MNNQIALMNEAFRRQPIDLEAMARTQRNNKRTVIDMDRLDTARALELTRMISHDDVNLRLAADILARKLSDSDMLNRIGKHAIEQNLEVASRYATEEDLDELGITKEDN